MQADYPRPSHKWERAMFELPEPYPHENRMNPNFIRNGAPVFLPSRHFASHPAPPLDFGNHFVGRGNECRHKSMARLQCAGEHGGVFNVFVNHLISKIAHGHPLISGVDQTQAFGPVKIVDCGGVNTLPNRRWSVVARCRHSLRTTRAKNRRRNTFLGSTVIAIAPL